MRVHRSYKLRIPVVIRIGSFLIDLRYLGVHWGIGSTGSAHLKGFRLRGKAADRHWSEVQARVLG
jgi:hypothetical protein